MRFHRVAVAVSLLALAVIAARKGLATPPDGEANSFAAADAQLLAEIHDHSEAMQNLEFLSDNIGPRLTGSPQLKQANDWTAETTCTWSRGPSLALGHAAPRERALFRPPSIRSPSLRRDGRRALPARFVVPWCISTRKQKMTSTNSREN